MLNSANGTGQFSMNLYHQNGTEKSFTYKIHKMFPLYYIVSDIIIDCHISYGIKLLL